MKTIFGLIKKEEEFHHKKSLEGNGRILEKEIIVDQGWKKLIDSVYRPEVCFLKDLNFSYENKSATAKLFVNYSNTIIPLEYVQASQQVHSLNLIMIAFMYEFISEYIKNLDSTAKFDYTIFKQIVEDFKFREAETGIKYHREIEQRKEFELEIELVHLRKMHGLFILGADINGLTNGYMQWVFPLNQKINEKNKMSDEERARQIERIRTNEEFLRKLAEDQYTNKKSKYSKK